MEWVAREWVASVPGGVYLVSDRHGIVTAAHATTRSSVCIRLRPDATAEDAFAACEAHKERQAALSPMWDANGAEVVL